MDTIKFEITKTTAFPRVTLDRIEHHLGTVTAVNSKPIAECGDILELGKKEMQTYVFTGSCNMYAALKCVASIPQGAVNANDCFRFHQFSINLDNAEKLKRSNAEIFSITTGIEYGSGDLEYVQSEILGV